MTELNEVIVRSKFDEYVSFADRLEYIDRLERRGKMVKTSSNFTDCRDSKDNKFLNLAFDGNAACLVTGDQDLQILNPFHRTKILAPSIFMELPI